MYKVLVSFLDNAKDVDTFEILVTCIYKCDAIKKADDFLRENSVQQYGVKYDRILGYSVL